jgi:hypothetical protein
MEERKLLTTNLPPPIEIAQQGDGYYKVTCGDRSEELTRDEALWAVSCYLHDQPIGYLRTKAEHEALRRILQTDDASDVLELEAQL